MHSLLLGVIVLGSVHSGCSKKSSGLQSKGAIVVTKKDLQEKQREVAHNAIEGSGVTSEQAKVIKTEIQKITFDEASSLVETAKTIVNTILKTGKQLGLTDSQLIALIERVNQSLNPLVLEQSRLSEESNDDSMSFQALLAGSVESLSLSGVKLADALAFLKGMIKSAAQNIELDVEMLKSTVCQYFQTQCDMVSDAELSAMFAQLVAKKEFEIPSALKSADDLKETDESEDSPLNTDATFPLDGFARFQSAFLLDGSQLPKCTEVNDSQMIFNSSLGKFQYCSQSEWKVIDLNSLISAVGSSTESDIAQAVSDIQGATSESESDTLVKRDSSGNMSVEELSAEKVSATLFVGDGSGLTNIPTSNPSAGGDLSGNISSATVTSVGGVSAANVAAGSNLANAATSSNTASAIVRRDSNGDIVVRNLTATNVSGDGSGLTNINAANVSLGGDLSGNANAASVDSVGGVSAANVAAGSNLANAATNTNTSNAVVRRDASGSFSAGTINATAFVGDGSGLTSLTYIGVRDMARGLRVISNDTDPAHRVDVTVDEILLQNSSGEIIRVTNFTGTADIEDSGENGLDTGAVTDDTWYYVWLVSDGSSTSLRISTSSTSPTAPGLPYLAMVSVFRTNSSSNIVSYVQVDRRVRYNSMNAKEFTRTVGTGWASHDISHAVPPKVKTVQFHLKCTISDGAYNQQCAIGLKGDSFSSDSSAGRSDASGYIWFAHHEVTTPLWTDQTIYTYLEHLNLALVVSPVGFEF